MKARFSRRGFLKAGAALAVASRSGLAVGAIEPPVAQSWWSQASRGIGR